MSRFGGTAYDIFNELAEYLDLQRSGAATPALLERLVRMVRWVRDDITELDSLVAALESAHLADPNTGGAYVLVAESGANILRSFGKAVRALELVQGQGTSDRSTPPL